MRALVQRVSEASVTVSGEIVGRIGRGLLIFLGVRLQDTAVDVEYLARKVGSIRVFADTAGKMNLNVRDISGQLLIVSQFTLYGDTRKGNRPSYAGAARPDEARSLYEGFIESCRSAGHSVEAGVFQAHMQVACVNDGPVTLLCSSESDVGDNQKI